MSLGNEIFGWALIALVALIGATVVIIFVTFALVGVWKKTPRLFKGDAPWPLAVIAAGVVIGLLIAGLGYTGGLGGGNGAPEESAPIGPMMSFGWRVSAGCALCYAAFCAVWQAVSRKWPWSK